MELKGIVKSKKSCLSKGLPENLSALQRAYRVTQRASAVGFDWPDIRGVLEKMDEEAREFKEALTLQNHKQVEEEFGDLLFALVNIARFLQINPENVLNKTTQKFISRFCDVETCLRKQGKSFRESTLGEMDTFWEAAKKKR